MRRLIGVLTVGVLVPALCFGVSRAAVPTLAIPAFDLGAQLAQRVFGETTAPVTESFLSERAFHVDLSAFTRQPAGFATVPVPAARLFVVPLPSAFAKAAPPAYVAAAGSADRSTLAESPAPIPVVGDYQGQRLIPIPAASADALLTFSGVLPQQGTTLSAPGRLGRVRFSTHAETAQAQAPDASVADRALGAGATLNLRAGRRNLGVNLSSTFEQVTFNASPTLGATDTLPAFVPSYADVSKRTLSAGLTVPISQRLTGSFQIDSQHLLGGYGMPGLGNLDANNTVYGARVTFQLPKSASAISLSAQQLHYQDNLIPTNAFVQTSANVDFTVKF